MFKKILGAKAIALAVAFSTVAAVVPSTVPVVGVSQASADWRGHPGWGGGPRYYDGGRRWHRGDYYRPRYYGRRHHSDVGAGVVGAIVGLGVGAAIASQAQPRVRYYEPAPVYAAPAYGRPAPWTSEWYRYCSARYRSFDPGSGTFQPYNGPRQLCR
ncbi:BA14K family protein [Consotaella salsifontis]|uniref:Lectin-like protein BA14k n=1 Tax=Consotaella salsifontis TaxID=1365950 RepID=A0A1T4M816_9HYPH|nr:BA14K family protein [Consotaella salsifontis]SJZ63180.1 BA14K-like protein [Consotaella salsifontis]